MNFLTRKYGPLPAWGWLGVVVAGYLGYKWWTGRAGTTSTAGAGTTPLGGGGSGSAGAPSPAPAPVPVPKTPKGPKNPPPIKHQPQPNPGPPISTRAPAWHPVPVVHVVNHPTRTGRPRPPWYGTLSAPQPTPRPGGVRNTRYK